MKLQALAQTGYESKRTVGAASAILQISPDVSRIPLISHLPNVK